MLPLKRSETTKAKGNGKGGRSPLESTARPWRKFFSLSLSMRNPRELALYEKLH